MIPTCHPADSRLTHDSLWHSYQSGYPYSYTHSWEGVDSTMPTDECQSAHPVPPVGTRDHRIVDYESSSEDEVMARLASKHMVDPNYNSTGHQNYVGAEPGRMLYASCVTGNKRSLPETLRVSGKKLHNLSAPKPANAMPGVCVDWNKGRSYDEQELEILNREKVWEKTRRQMIEQCKMSSFDDAKRNLTQGLINDESRNAKGRKPELWSQMRRNRYITDNPDFEETHELETRDRKENIPAVIREEMKPAGHYPYENFQKVIPKYDETGNCCKKTHIPQLIPPGHWSRWAIGKSPESLKRDAHTSVHECSHEPLESRNETETNPLLSTPSPPPPMPVCPPYWGDPRMSFPVPAFYPPQWLPSYPSNYSPGFMSYPPPSSTTSPTNVSPSMNTGSTTMTSPTSTSTRFPYRSQQTTSFRSRTTSAPAPVLDQITERVEEQSGDKSCTSYFLAAKNRRVSDSVLRTDTEVFVPRRSSYASRLHNDARLNANFPQLDWKIRLKSRCKGYGVGFIDTHCHLDFLFSREGFKGTFAKYMLKHEETFPDTFEGCVAVFCNPASFLPKGGMWRDVVMESKVWLAMGCHPKNVTSFDTVAVDGLKQCILHPRVIAVGEIGLDYSGTFRQHEVLQKKMFAYQLQLALDVKKPLVIHCRQAEEDCLAIMEEIVPKNYKIHCHCFTGTYEQCKKWLTKFPKLYIGLTNLVSFRSATPTHEVAKHIPLGRLLLETDAPYFVPRQIPKGSFELSHPGMAVLVAEEVARIKEISVGQVLKACRSNTCAMYGI
ncbi:putative deoxyribonuclease TATDN2 isoform X1 [Haliotis rubra]|uniref:putative deoxyribonuclease TATDN2 isoform X1 n=2 Tax=Haliotis rubra TaxID=36100 RepID=UPI001EE5E263|nr:putative deoxyribonuclease TATDN2 isoform X1 [Haliotis rubra]